VNTQVTSEPTAEQVHRAVDTLKLIADPTRLRILWALLHGEHSVNLLAEHVGAQPAAVSQHLAKLRLARLVRTRREGTHVYYLAEDDHVRRLVEEALFQADATVKGHQ
jgi:DNA-binding transcriptional ArsR family regulator